MSRVRQEANSQKEAALQKAQAKQFRSLSGHAVNIYRLMIKEIRSILADPIMLALVVYAFSFAAVATGASTEVTNLAVGIVDEDHSDLSRQIADGLTPPLFKPVADITATEIDAAMDSERLVFGIEIPPNFQADILAGRRTSVQVNVDATAITQAGNGTIYIESITARSQISSQDAKEASTSLSKWLCAQNSIQT